MSEAKTGKGSAVGKGCLIIVAVLVGLTVLGAIVGDKDGGDSTANTDAAAIAEQPAIQVTAKELAQAYDANEAAAQQAYGDRVLEVSAIISGIQLGLTNKPFLVLEGTNQFMGPHAELDDESQKMAASLAKGQNVKLTCRKVSEVIGTPMLDECHID